MWKGASKADRELPVVGAKVGRGQGLRTAALISERPAIRGSSVERGSGTLAPFFF